MPGPEKSPLRLMGVRYTGQSGKVELSLLMVTPLSGDGKVLKLDSSGNYIHLFTD